MDSSLRFSLLASIWAGIQKKQPGFSFGFRSEEDDLTDVVLLIDGEPSVFQMDRFEELVAKFRDETLVGLAAQYEAVRVAVDALIAEGEE